MNWFVKSYAAPGGAVWHVTEPWGSWFEYHLRCPGLEPVEIREETAKLMLAAQKALDKDIEDQE